MKQIPFPFGPTHLELNLPDSDVVRTAGAVAPLPDPAAAIRHSLNNPIGTPPLHKLAQGRRSAAVVVSDNTRPVPYKGPGGILPPLIDTLQTSGVKKITIIVACGTHRPMAPEELRDLLGPAAFTDGVRVINHACTDETMLRTIGRTDRTPRVALNRHYLEADLKIATGLVEPHFMAGFSGGRKAICPGICSESVTYGFHSAAILNHPHAASLILEGNPCHEESLRIARMAGVDFILNVTIDSRKQLTGVFAGHLEKAHRAAVDYLRSYATIGLDCSYDVVITQAGDVGVNHYQCAKAACEANRAVKPGGKIVLAAHLTDPDPIGGRNYKTTLRLAALLGPARFIDTICAEGHAFVPEQWQVQMWAKVMLDLQSPKNLYICAARLQNAPGDLFCEVNVAAQSPRRPDESDSQYTCRLLQQTIDQILAENPAARLLVLPDGPYAIPVVQP